ncbi:MAG: VIT domain-containing protein, partial [Verrucomicrobia bacterium]|nr:VIT domain-containing protein [Verrucomicrobiota bacterium]
HRPAPHPLPIVPPGHFSFAPLAVNYHRVGVEINDLTAITSIDQEFYNPNNARLEGTYIFPLPPGAHIDKFAMDIDGAMTEAELLSPDKARALYEDIVRQMKDPALLEYVGRDAFKVRIFPIEPNSRKRIKISYTRSNAMAKPPPSWDMRPKTCVRIAISRWCSRARPIPWVSI